jgi:hypothetical protein
MRRERAACKNKRKESGSFLKKRTKKLLIFLDLGAQPARASQQRRTAPACLRAPFWPIGRVGLIRLAQQNAQKRF